MQATQTQQIGEAKESLVKTMRLLAKAGYSYASAFMFNNDTLGFCVDLTLSKDDNEYKPVMYYREEKYES